jgi:hypothetical protein
VGGGLWDVGRSGAAFFLGAVILFLGSAEGQDSCEPGGVGPYLGMIGVAGVGGGRGAGPSICFSLVTCGGHTPRGHTQVLATKPPMLTA